MHNNFLFDLDMTLLDFHATERIALELVVKDNGCTFSDDLYTFFKARNKELWLKLENGEITRQELFVTRFKLLFETLGKDTFKMDLLKINGSFITYMAHNGVLMDGALEFLRKLKTIEDSRICIISNGATVNAEGRMRSTGLDTLVDEVFISETIGATKPSTDFFDIVLETIGEPRENCIVIGDSLTSDMLGAKNARIASCWFMPQGDIGSAMREYDINYKAENYDVLFEVLKKWSAVHNTV